MKAKCFRRGPDYTREYRYHVNIRTGHCNEAILRAEKRVWNTNGASVNEVTYKFNKMDIFIVRTVKFGLLGEKNYIWII